MFHVERIWHDVRDFRQVRRLDRRVNPLSFNPVDHIHNCTTYPIIEFCRQRIAHFKAPKHVEFGELPKTATGKIQKYILREREWQGHEKRIR